MSESQLPLDVRVAVAFNTESDAKALKVHADASHFSFLSLHFFAGCYRISQVVLGSLDALGGGSAVLKTMDS